MDNTLKKIKRFCEKHNKILMQAFKTTLVFLYAAIFIVVVYNLYFQSSLTNFDDLIYQRGIERNSDIFVIGITDEDIAYFDEDASALAARVAKKLNSDERFYPSAIGFDVPLVEITEETKSDILEAGEAHDNLVLAVELGVDESLMLDSFDRTATPIVSESVLLPDSELLEVADIGHNAKISDKNAVIRHAVFDIEGSDGENYESISWVCYEKYCKTKGIEAKMPELSERNTAIIKYTDKDVTYTYSARDILNGQYDVTDLHEKIVFVGYFSTALDSGYVTSIDYLSKSHTVQIDADITNDLLEDSFASVINYSIQMHTLIVVILIIAFFVLNNSLLASFCINILYMILLFVFSILIYGVGYQAYITPHIVSALITSLLFGFIGYRMRATRRETNLKAMLNRYIDENNVNSIIAESNNVDLGIGVYKPDKVKSENVAVLFADIRGFTKISESMEAKELVGMLNEYLSAMAECVEKYNGTLDKYIGDCAMAFWPANDKDAVYHACLAASEMQRKVQEVLGRFSEYAQYNIKIGVSINYGEAVVGNIGSRNRMNYTIIGDSVNVASRIEDLVPADKIYLSEFAYNELKKNNYSINAELVDEKVPLRGKQKKVGVYDLKAITVQDIHKEGISEEDETKFRGNRYIAAILNFIIFLIQLTTAASFIIKKGVDYLPYFNINLSIVSAAVLAVLIYYDVSFNTKNIREYRPRWLDIIFLTALAANIKCFVAFVVRGIPKYGALAISGEAWAGGMSLNLICPLLVVMSFFFFEYQVNYSLFDVMIAETPLATLLVISTYLATKAGLDVRNPELFDIYFTFPSNAISIILEYVGVYMLTTINKKLKLQEKINVSQNQSLFEKYKYSKIAKLLNETHSKRIILLVFNSAILLISVGSLIYGTVDSIAQIYSNAALNDVIIAICAAVQVVILALALKTKGEFRIPLFYKYLTFVKGVAAIINFFTAIILTNIGFSLSVFVLNYFGFNWLTFVLIPILCIIVMNIEKNEYQLGLCVLSSLPSILVLIISRLSIEHYGGKFELAKEMAAFYSNGRIAITIILEIFSAVVLFIVSTIMIRIGRVANRELKNLTLQIAGTRKGIVGDIPYESIYGLTSNCYVLKDDDYAIIVGAGSGFIEAKELVKDCTRIDIILNEKKFDAVSGFLATPKINPYATVRIFSPFDFNKFSMHPFWPVDVIEGSRIKVEEGKRFRLTTSYSASFISSDKDGRYILKVFAEKATLPGNEFAVGFTSWIPENQEFVAELANDTYALVFTNLDKWKDACYLAIDNKIPELYIGGYRNDITDEQIMKFEEEAKKIFFNVEFVKAKGKHKIY